MEKITEILSDKERAETSGFIGLSNQDILLVSWFGNPVLTRAVQGSGGDNR